MKKILIFVLTMLMLLNLIFIGCTNQQSSTSISTSTSATPKYGGTLRINQGPPITGTIGWVTGNPFGYKGSNSLYYETLLKCDNTGKISPCLATGIEIADDLKSMTLTLRQNVKFHDGSDFNATVAKWNLDLAIAAKIGEVAPITSVDIIDNYKIRLNVSEYSNTLLTTLSNATEESKAAYDAAGGGKAGADYLSYHPVGTGPFQFVSYEPNVQLKVARFDGYWQTGKPYLDAVEVSYITDPQTRANALEAGEIDLALADFGKPEYDLVNKGFTAYRGYAAVVSIFPDGNNTDSPFNNIKVRQAIDYAIDRDSIARNLGFTFMVPTVQYCSPDSPAYIKDLATRTYNEAKAKQLLEEANYGGGFTTQLRCSPTANQDVVVAIQGFLSKIGITAEIVPLDFGAYTQEQMNGWHGLAVAGAMLTANPHIVLADMCRIDSAVNVSLAKSQELNDLYFAAIGTKEFDPELFKKETRCIYENAIFLPLYLVVGGGICQPWVRDSGCTTGSIASTWTPTTCWIDK